MTSRVKSRIGLNIHAQVVKQHTRLLGFLEATQPAAVVVLDGYGLAKDIKQICPDTKIIIREYGSKGDDTLHTQMSPEQFLKERGHLATNGEYLLYTANEPGYDKPILQWTVMLMELAVKVSVPLVVGHFSVGVPRPEEWGLARRMLELLDEHRNLFTLGLHEYGGGVMTSGLVGGAPDGYGQDEKGNRTGPHHPPYIQPEDWPAKAAGLTQFHCGRFNFLVQYCQSVGIKPPNIILTEHGMDDLSDIGFWLKTLKVHPPYLNIRGWKTLIDQWNAWYGGRGWSPERAYFEQLKWADQAIYQGSVVEGQCIFSWGHSSDMWEPFDIQDALELQGNLIDYAKPAPAPTPTPQPPPVVVIPTPAPVPPPHVVELPPAPIPQPKPVQWYEIKLCVQATPEEAAALAATLSVFSTSLSQMADVIKNIKPTIALAGEE